MDVTKIVSLPAAFVRQLARFERVSLFTSFMGGTAALGIALVIAKALSSKATVQPAEQLGHGPSLDEDVT